MTHAFSKIWIIVIVVIFIAGGISAWQYFGVPKEETKAPVVIQSETNQCEEIKSLEGRGMCFIDLAITENDPSVCWKVETASLGSSCWELFGMKEWKIYENENYNFGIKYPPDYEEYGKDFKPETSFAAYSIDDDRTVFASVVEIEESFQTFIDWYAKEGVLGKTSIFVAGKPAVTIEFGPRGMGDLYDIETKIDVSPGIIISISTSNGYSYLKRGVTIDKEWRDFHNQILSTFRFSESLPLKILLPEQGEWWEIGKTNTIKLSRAVEQFYGWFVHLTLNEVDGKEVGIISCKIAGTKTATFEWDTKIVLNYCGAGLEGKTKEIKPGTYKIAITKDVTGRPILTESELFLITEP